MAKTTTLDGKVKVLINFLERWLIELYGYRYKLNWGSVLQVGL